MLMNSKDAEYEAVILAAYELAAAARTAPKACGIDHLDTMIVTGEELGVLSEAMRDVCGRDETNFMYRDAGNVDACQAVVLIGAKLSPRGLGKSCSLCKFDGCDECKKEDGVCAFDMIDLGIALGSAVSKAADLRMDNRIMYSIGKGVNKLGWMEDCAVVMGIPLSVSGKSPFFDRKKK